jgi:hypothetical protein
MNFHCGQANEQGKDRFLIFHYNELSYILQVGAHRSFLLQPFADSYLRVESVRHGCNQKMGNYARQCRAQG